MSRGLEMGPGHAPSGPRCRVLRPPLGAPHPSHSPPAHTRTAAGAYPHRRRRIPAPPPAHRHTGPAHTHPAAGAYAPCRRRIRTPPAHTPTAAGAYPHRRRRLPTPPPAHTHTAPAHRRRQDPRNPGCISPQTPVRAIGIGDISAHPALMSPRWHGTRAVLRVLHAPRGPPVGASSSCPRTVRR